MPTEIDGVKIKDWSNWSCGEPKSCYFNRFTILPSGLFLQLDGVKIKDWSNWSCGEPKSGYFNPKAEAFSWFKLQEPSFFYASPDSASRQTEELEKKTERERGG